MAPRIGTPAERAATIVLPLALAIIFALLIGKHYEIDGSDIERVARGATNAAVITGNRVGVLDTCGERELTIFSPTVYVCNTPGTTLAYADIYHRYPIEGDGQEVVYSFLDNGSQERADEMLENTYDLERYEPVTLPGAPTWTEDPYDERYWRFLFYSMRPVRHLLDAALDTRDPRYFAKVREITESFVTTGMEAEHAWDDAHGVAFRTMMLVNIWWKLREAGELPVELSDQLLRSLVAHGEYLADPAHYEGDYNHGITQAAALLVLAESFPDLGEAPLWRELARERLATGLRDVVDEDGVLVENSPYYHFYVLEKYWEIYKYVNEQEIVVSEDFNATIEGMVEHATYVLQPDRDLPLLGASISRTITPAGEFREIADDVPTFAYAVTQGASGSPPPELHRRFPSSGIVLLRSGWGEDRPYDEEAQALFDAGPYRTDHSDLDALSLSFYTAGTRVLRDAGLFTYEADHPFYAYFHGTRGHNTVMVDGIDQARGSGESLPIAAGDGYALAQARHELYPGVVHRRTVLLLEAGALLIVDDIAGSVPHTYEQLFHLPADASLSRTESETVSGTIGSVPFSITQFLPVESLETWTGDRDAMRGFCANEYEVLLSCPELAYRSTGANARFVTLVQAGSGVQYAASYEEGAITVTTPDARYQVTIDAADPYVALTVDSDVADNPNASWWQRVRGFWSRLF